MDNQPPFQPLNPDQTQDPLVPPNIMSALKRPFEKKPKIEMWKVAVPAVFILALIVGVVMFWFSREATPQTPNTLNIAETAVSPVPTETWMTYTNAKYQFSLEYPSDWAKTESPSGNGVTFIPFTSSGTPGVTDDITVNVGQKTMTEEVLSFEEYARVAATHEIQNYNQLASIEPVTLANGMVGYKTTWMVQSIADHTSPESESSPITYFEIPGLTTHLLRVSSGHDVDPAIYERMIKSLLISSTSNKPVSSATPKPAVTPTPVVNEEAALKATIKDQILADSESDGSSLTVSVTQISGDYAKGMASDDGGGGLWFAAKVNGSWKLVWDGNGVIFCSDLKEYPSFPTSMIPECYDAATEQLVKR